MKAYAVVLNDPSCSDAFEVIGVRSAVELARALKLEVEADIWNIGDEDSTVDIVETNFQ